MGRSSTPRGFLPLGGLLVSHHFSRLCQYRLNLEIDPPRETALLRAFLQEQRRQQKRLLAEAPATELSNRQLGRSAAVL